MPGGSRMNPDAIKLVHLSDVHFGREDREALEQVADFTSRVKPDAVILAGTSPRKGGGGNLRWHANGCGA